MIPKDYTTTLVPGAHWSLTVRRGMQMQLTDTQGGANIGMLFYNPLLLSEKYNAPDSLKCQHTFKVTRGHCLYSDMGRIFASIIEDSFGWHDTVCGNTHPKHIADRWGKKNYQSDRNAWLQNGHDAFLVELAKYRLKKQDLATQSQLKLLAYGRPLVVVEDYNGNFRMAGFENGAEVVVNTASGAAMGDLNGYNITFTGTEKEPASFIDATIIGDTTNTTVVSGT